MFGRGIKGLPSLLHEPVETVAAALLALEPAVGRQPRHRGAHHAAVDVDCFEKLPQRSEPNRTAARHDRIAEHRDDNGPGARGFALELFDDAGKRMRHAQRIARFFWIYDNARPAATARRDTSPSPRSRGEGDSPRIQLVESPPHPDCFAIRPLPASGAR